jgi:5'-3' exonuclease
MENESYQNLLESFKENRKEREKYHKNSKILIVDGLNTFIRSFAVNPTRNNNGVHIGGIGGCLKSMGYAIRKFNPTRCIVVFDGKGGSKRRKKIFGDYKSGRSSGGYNRNYDFEDEDEDEAMKRQIVRTVEYMQCLPLTLMSIDHIEADDAIAYLCKQVYTEEDNQKIVMSSDRDFLQLVDETTKIWSPTKKNVYDREAVIDEYGVPPRNFIIWRMIEGDSSDSIPGVKYVGQKKVQDKLGDVIERDDPQRVDDVIEYAKDRLDESRTYERLVENEDVMRRNWELMQLYDVNISAEKKSQVMDLARQEIPPLDKNCFRSLFLQDQMQAAIKGMESWLKKTFRTLNKMRTVEKQNT